MATVPYPDIPQCEGSSRNEVTVIYSDFSESGNVHARVFHITPTYDLLLVHNDLTRSQFSDLEDWWANYRGAFTSVTWVADNLTYEGFILQPPEVEYVDYQRFNVRVTLRCKKRIGSSV
jgi:hypothetical protein